MKKFFFTDKTGRGVNSTLNENQAKVFNNDVDEIDWTTDQPLPEFMAEAEVGDEWENRTMKFVRTE